VLTSHLRQPGPRRPLLPAPQAITHPSRAQPTGPHRLPGCNADALVPSVISAMLLQSIIWWLEHDRPCPPDEIAGHSSRLIRAVIEATAGAPDS